MTKILNKIKALLLLAVGAATAIGSASGVKALGAGDDDEITYVSLGDSMTSGFGFDDYYVDDDPDANSKGHNWSSEDGHKNVRGFLVEASESYAGLIRDRLVAENPGKTVNWVPLAINASRIDDIYYELSGDENTDEFFQSIMDAYHPGDQWNEIWGNRAKSKGWTTQTNLNKAVTETFQKAIAKADLVTLSAGFNNFGCFLSGKMSQFIEPAPFSYSFGGHDTLQGFIDRVGLDLDAEELYQQAKDVVNQVAGFDISAYEDIEIPGFATLRVKRFFELLTLSFVSYCYYMNQTTKLIREMNPNAELVVVGMCNSIRGMRMNVAGVTIDMEEIFNWIFKAANMYAAVGTEKADEYKYADVTGLEVQLHIDNMQFSYDTEAETVDLSHLDDSQKARAYAGCYSLVNSFGMGSALPTYDAVRTQINTMVNSNDALVQMNSYAPTYSLPTYTFSLNNYAGGITAGDKAYVNRMHISASDILANLMMYNPLLIGAGTSAAEVADAIATNVNAGLEEYYTGIDTFIGILCRASHNSNLTLEQLSALGSGMTAEEFQAGAYDSLLNLYIRMLLNNGMWNHPNKEGHEAIFGAAWNAIESEQTARETGIAALTELFNELVEEYKPMVMDMIEKAYEAAYPYIEEGMAKAQAYAEEAYAYAKEQFDASVAYATELISEVSEYASEKFNEGIAYLEEKANELGNYVAEMVAQGVEAAKAAAHQKVAEGIAHIERKLRQAQALISFAIRSLREAMEAKVRELVEFGMMIQAAAYQQLCAELNLLENLYKQAIEEIRTAIVDEIVEIRDAVARSVELLNKALYEGIATASEELNNVVNGLLAKLNEATKAHLKELCAKAREAMERVHEIAERVQDHVLLSVVVALVKFTQVAEAVAQELEVRHAEAVEFVTELIIKLKEKSVIAVDHLNKTLKALNTMASKAAAEVKEMAVKVGEFIVEAQKYINEAKLMHARLLALIEEVNEFAKLATEEVGKYCSFAYDELVELAHKVGLAIERAEAAVEYAKASLCEQTRALMELAHDKFEYAVNVTAQAMSQLRTAMKIVSEAVEQISDTTKAVVEHVSEVANRTQKFIVSVMVYAKDASKETAMKIFEFIEDVKATVSFIKEFADRSHAHLEALKEQLLAYVPYLQQAQHQIMVVVAKVDATMKFVVEMNAKVEAKIAEIKALVADVEENLGLYVIGGVLYVAQNVREIVSEAKEMAQKVVAFVEDAKEFIENAKATLAKVCAMIKEAEEKVNEGVAHIVEYKETAIKQLKLVKAQLEEAIAMVEEGVEHVKAAWKVAKEVIETVNSQIEVATEYAERAVEVLREVMPKIEATVRVIAEVTEKVAEMLPTAIEHTQRLINGIVDMYYEVSEGVREFAEHAKNTIDALVYFAQVAREHLARFQRHLYMLALHVNYEIMEIVEKINVVIDIVERFVGQVKWQISVVYHTIKAIKDAIHMTIKSIEDTIAQIIASYESLPESVRGLLEMLAADVKANFEYDMHVLEEQIEKGLLDVANRTYETIVHMMEDVAYMKNAAHYLLESGVERAISDVVNGANAIVDTVMNAAEEINQSVIDMNEYVEESLNGMAEDIIEAVKEAIEQLVTAIEEEAYLEINVDVTDSVEAYEELTDTAEECAEELVPEVEDAANNIADAIHNLLVTWNLA